MIAPGRFTTEAMNDLSVPNPISASRSLLALRVAGLAGWTAVNALTGLHHIIAGRGVPTSLSRRWHRGAARIAGIDIRTHGRMLQTGPALIVANHVSYLDIVVLGSIIEGAFVAKSEVESWPVFGWLARQQRTVFIERNARHATAHRDVIRERLEKGERLILFPEGTSSDGNRTLGFKSTLFDVASIEVEGATVPVQPVSIAYSRFDGMPMGRAIRPFYAWYGDMELAPHLSTSLALGKVGVDVVFHQPVTFSDYGNRKALAAACNRMVQDGLERALTGRSSDFSPARIEGAVAT